MQEDKLLPHVENLVPGYVTLLLLAHAVPSHLHKVLQELPKLLGEGVIAGLILTATAYQIGVDVFIVSRLFVDTASELTFRWILLLAFDRRDFWPTDGKGWKEWQGLPLKINERYRATVNEALAETSKPLARQEVIKRRERGRLVRTAVLPGSYVAYLSPWGGWGLVVAFAAVVFLYAYAEVAVYKEAKLARL